MDNYETGIYTDNPDDTLRYMQTTQPVDLWGYPKQETDLVEVVRCKDCEHWQQFGNDFFGNCDFGHGVTDIEFYCRDNERRNE